MAKYQTMPALSDEDRAALTDSIMAYGVRVPIIVDEMGAIIDGHHRKEIADQLRVHCPQIVYKKLSDADKIAMSISLNVDRRQLSREERREIVAASLRAQPELSDRQHAERVGVSPSTAGAVRGDLEAAGELSKLDSRTSADGRQRPASQPPVKASIAPDTVEHTARWSEPKLPTNVNAATGEIVQGPEIPPSPAPAEPDRGKFIAAVADAVLGPDTELAKIDAEAESSKSVWAIRRPALRLIESAPADFLAAADVADVDLLVETSERLFAWATTVQKIRYTPMRVVNGGKS